MACSFGCSLPTGRLLVLVSYIAQLQVYNRKQIGGPTLWSTRRYKSVGVFEACQQAPSIARRFAPRSQKDQQSGAQAPEQHGARFWNLMERLHYYRYSNFIQGGDPGDINTNVFGYLKRALRRRYGEKVVFPYVECTIRSEKRIWVGNISNAETRGQITMCGRSACGRSNFIYRKIAVVSTPRILLVNH